MIREEVRIIGARTRKESMAGNLQMRDKACSRMCHTSCGCSQTQRLGMGLMKFSTMRGHDARNG